MKARHFCLPVSAVAGIGLAAAIGVSFGSVGVAHATTLKEAVKLSLSNPEVREAQANRRAIDHDLREAKGLYLPALDLRASIGPDHLNSPSTRAAGTDDDWLWTRQASLTLSQKILDAGTLKEIDRQKALVTAAAARVVERSEFIGLDAVQAYLDVLRQTQLVRLAEDNVKTMTSTLDDVQARVRGGRSSVADQRQAENRVTQARIDLVNAQRRLDDVRAQYLRVVGTQPTELSRPTLPAGAVPESLDVALRLANSDNPSVVAASRDINAADIQIKVNEARWLPEVDLVMSASKGQDLGGLEGLNNEYSALVIAKWNLYSGGSDEARRKGSVERAQQARDHLRTVQIKSDEETRRTWNALVRQREQVSILRERVKASEETLTAYSQQFRVGQRELLDVLDQKNDVFAANTELTTAEYAELFASYRLLSVIGALAPTLDIAYPEEAKDGTAPAASSAQSSAAKPAVTEAVAKPAVDKPKAKLAVTEAPAKPVVAKPQAKLAVPAKSAVAKPQAKPAITQALPKSQIKAASDLTKATPSAPVEKTADAATDPFAPDAVAPGAKHPVTIN